MEEYDDDSCYSCFEGHQALHLIGWSPPNSQRANVGDNKSDLFEMEDQRISRMLKTLENNLLVEKDHEIEKLRNDLLVQTENKKYFENLADSYTNYIAVLRVQFGSLISGLTSNFVSATSPVGNKDTPNELLCTLKSVSNKLTNQAEIESPLGFLLKQVIDALNTNQHLKPAASCLTAASGVNGGIVNFELATNPSNPINPSTERVQNKNVTEALISQRLAHDNQSNSQNSQSSNGTMNSNNDQIDVALVKLKCSVCSVTFTLNSELQKHCQEVHQVNSHTNIQYKCSLCKISFNTLSECNIHFNTTHNHNVRATEPEPNDNDDNMQLDENAETESQRSNNLTDGCSNNSVNSSQKHGVEYSKTKSGYLFVCLCGFVNHKMSDLEKHINRQSTLLKFKCPACPKRFPVVSLMRSHMKSHKVKEMNAHCVVCSICHSRFYSWELFQAHLTTIHRINSQSNPKVGMDNHQRDYTRRDAYFCICGNSYKSQHALKSHFKKMKFDRNLRVIL